MKNNTRYVYLRYATQSYKSNNANTRQFPPLAEPDKPDVADYGNNVDNPAYQAALKEFQLDLKQYQVDKTRPTLYPNGLMENKENLLDQVKFVVENIDIDIDIGHGSYEGLSMADEANWYIKPIMISMSGDSIISNNPLLASDNIVLNIYRKLTQELSENNYNYFKKPKFILQIDNGLKGLDTYKGVITKFTIKEQAKIPDKYDFTLSFIGKPSTDEQIDRAVKGFANDNNAISLTAIEDALGDLNAKRIN